MQISSTQLNSVIFSGHGHLHHFFLLAAFGNKIHFILHVIAAYHFSYASPNCGAFDGIIVAAFLCNGPAIFAGSSFKKVIPVLIESIQVDTYFFCRLLGEYLGVNRLMLVKGGQWEAAFCIQSAKARGWAQEELDLIREVAEWTWSEVERTRAEETLRHFNETLEQKVAERTALAENCAKQLQFLAVELIEAEERERQRIALLLHEDLQQILAAARFQLQAAFPNLAAESKLLGVDQLLEDSNIINQSTHKAGFGLMSIKERVSNIGGSLNLDSSPGKGSRSVLAIPMNIVGLTAPSRLGQNPL